ncbi:MAG: hypothetical protein U9Q83_06385 [Bacteroidota bacterium]|nr:hypothetical protein [Bacteroidota bacterium]
MEKLNSIFYGPAGTGKTRESIKQAVEIVKKSNDSDALNLSEYETSNYDGIISLFNNVSNLPELNITDNDLLSDIQNPSIDIEKKKYRGYSKADLINMKNDVLEYRLYPLIETVTFHPSYSYQDFVEGITVETNKNNKNIEYIVKDGIFKKICKRAIDNPNYNYVLSKHQVNPILKSKQV